MKRQEINRYAVYNDGLQTDIIPATKDKKRHRWCKCEDVEQLEAYCDKLEEDKQELVKALEFIYEECDWEEVTVNFSTYGDNRIGNVCSKWLGLKEKNK